MECVREVLNDNSFCKTSLSSFGTLFVEKLNLINFRCYEKLSVKVDKGPVVLTGPNGSGKTNILEAISYLVPGRGLRGAKYTDLTFTSLSAKSDVSQPMKELRRHIDNPLKWAISGKICFNGLFTDIGTGLEQTSEVNLKTRRVVKIDGKNCGSQSALGHHLSALWVTPSMDRLFAEGAAGRRRFVDRLVVGLDPEHAARVTEYESCMRGRNKLLKEGTYNKEWLSSLEETMVTSGVALAASRLGMIEKLNEITSEQYGVFPAAELGMKGKLEGWLFDIPAIEVEDKYRASLLDSRQYDCYSGTTDLGPHKSDLAVLHRKSGMEASKCSTGEQKALLIRIVLAAAALQHEEKSKMPIMLLDEVGAHLDKLRRSELFSIIGDMGVQAWMTGTDRSLFENSGFDTQYFNVFNSTLTEAS